ncbi:MAG: tRNA pseudouridine(13) synthase TruD [Meiothermus sp.]|uniref:tRNA pseudouridine(13) synthase TruD n=1 Tax=Meiothermus sp. TaxID=1955249 RepID=UPI0025CB9552|nr:tRNA pseudouridine(13) synthase TruD [Meiothermus sp.]MCS7193865.1 tRNA pseudouridine(13) synthase TruD [Meiothermus sp.]MDW8090188.1 tRNA pseudouridine(13) synthase TruD [Meiothermus sp.]MDW8481490.1 tRNA pseudouridine(13) synthase TruD [Meiothermus sp.]
MVSLRFDFNAYPYLTADLPGVEGVIRSRPEEFQVCEVPAYLPRGEGEHLFLLLEKRGLTTRAVLEFLRDRLGVSEEQIGVAGLKDKHALTQQWISLPSRYEARLEVLQELPGLRLLHWARHPHKLRVGHLKGNRFRILIRGATAPDSAERVRAVLSRLAQQGVPNYYGPQRFGLGGLNPQKGYALATRGKAHTPPWLGRFLLASLQSLLFNDWLALRMKLGLFDRVVEGDVAKKHDTGGEFWVEDAGAENPRAQRFEISATGALFGRKYREARGAARALEDQVLEKYGLTRQHFARRRGDRRPIRLPLTEWDVEAVPEGVWVSFFLPKGAYATAVLREVMKRDPEARLEEEPLAEDP